MTYRLLRDNKETGPFSEEEMIAIGFKPYDLIWVEGKSAGWRYPSEIPAFKNFAPVVEEQPYDRFFKKQPPQKHFGLEERNVPASYTQTVTKEKTFTPKESEPIQAQQAPPVAASYRPVPEYNIQSIPAKHIHVTLPSGNTVNLTTLVAKSDTNAKENVQPNKPAPIATSPAALVEKEPNYKITAVAAETDKADKKIVYTNTSAVYQPATPGFSWGLIAAAVVGLATLLGLGIMIGLSINKDKSDLVFNESIRNKSKQKTLQQTENTVVKPASIPDAPATTLVNETLHPVPAANGKELVQNAVVKNTLAPQNSSELKETKKLPDEKLLAGKQKPLTQQDERVAVPSISRPANTSVNLAKELSLTPNEFKTGTFGGITGLKYTLFNASKFPVESVIIEIDYIQANNKVFKTERLLFKDVSAGAQTTIDAPASSRGVKINGRIIKVNSKEASLTNNTTAKS